MKRYLYLPKQYDLIVGEPFELFFRGLVNSVSIDTYDFELSYTDGKNRGKGFHHKYYFVPNETDLGMHTLNIRLRGNEGDILDEGSCTINVVKPPVSPKSERVVLLMGASDTAPGIWTSEFGRRLTMTGGEPEGLGLNNISFIGSREKNGIRYEGYGGWTFRSYLTDNKRNDFMNIYGDFSDKDSTVDQHSSYKDENGQLWKLETITPTKMKIICHSALGVLPSTEGGRLVHESGGQNLGDIVYTSAERADANPYWSDEKKANDFRAYVKKFGKDKIDEIIVTLTWNSFYWKNEVFEATVREFIASVHADFPDCHISFVGGLFPSRDGFAQNYGISWPWFPRLEVLRSFDAIREKIVAEDPEHLSFVSIAAQYDVDHNGIYADFPANNRNPESVHLGSNGLHISTAGQHQIGDAIYRHFATRFQE
ncbi:MAG: SGNH/GDSL hydrolase family protein [Ruminococcaceae bacterium]|nr:SGNH/GDSL hydrolase family protein [Oscillospiraceae bacterium]